MPEDLENSAAQNLPSSGHEADTVPVGGVVGGALGIVALVVGSCLLMYAAYGFLAARPAASPSPLSLVPESPSRAGPSLNADQASRLRALRAAEEQQLDGYGWVDQTSGIARIPIGRAMQLLAKEGLRRPGAAPGTPLMAPPPSSQPQKSKSPEREPPRSEARKQAQP